MATKVKTGVIDSGAITSALITDASITADDLHTTLDLTGKTVTVATASASDNDTSVASTAYVTTAIANLADSAPSTLNTLNELAAALGDDENFSTTVTNSIATKLPLAGGTMTGTLAMGSNAITSTGTISSGDVNITSAAPTVFFTDSDGTNQNTTVKQSGGNFFVIARDNTANAGIVFAGNASGTYDEYARFKADGNFGIGNNDPDLPLTVTSNSGANAIAVRARSADDYGFIQFYNHAGSTLRGQIFNHNGAMAISTDTTGTARLHIDTAGNVGIGTTSPLEKLDVNSYTGISVNNNYAHMGSTVSGGMAIFGHNIKSDSANNTIKSANTGYHSSMIKMYYDEGITFHSTSGTQTAGNTFYDIAGTTNEHMRITNAGNVGINTLVPSNKLSIKGQGNNWGTSPAIKLWDDTYNTGWYVGTANNQAAGDFYIRTVTSEGAYPVAGNQQFTMTSSGNVGLGMILPTEKLDVLGTINVQEGQVWNPTTQGGGRGSIHIDPNDGTAHAGGSITFGASDTGNGTSAQAGIYVRSDGTYGTKMYLSTTDSYAAGSKTAMSIDHYGNVIVKGSLHAAGHVIQTVYATNSTLVVPSQTINDYTTFIQVNITPKYATSKILITGIAGVEVSGGNYPTVHCRLYRDSTHIKSYLYWGYEGAETTHRILNEPIHFLDSPTTTSALTYYAKLANSSGSSYTGTYSGKAHAYNPSTIMVQEIAQ